MTKKPLYFAAGLSYLLTLNLFVSAESTHWENLIGFGMATVIEYCKYRAFALCVDLRGSGRSWELGVVGGFALVLMTISLTASMATLSGDVINDEVSGLRMEIIQERVRAASALNDRERVTHGANPTLDRAEAALEELGTFSTFGTLARALSDVTGITPFMAALFVNLLVSLVIELGIVFLLYEQREFQTVPQTDTTTVTQADTPRIQPKQERETPAPQELEYRRIKKQVAEGACVPGPRPIAKHFDINVSKSQKIVKRLVDDQIIQKKEDGKGYELVA